MPIRCWPIFKPVAVPSPRAPVVGQSPHVVGNGHRHVRRVYRPGHHRPASRLVFAGLSCVVVPAAIAGLATAFGAPSLLGGPSGPTVIGLSPAIGGLPGTGQAPVTAVPEPSSLALFATAIALTMAVYWSGVWIGYWFSIRRNVGNE